MDRRNEEVLPDDMFHPYQLENDAFQFASSTPSTPEGTPNRASPPEDLDISSVLGISTLTDDTFDTSEIAPASLDLTTTSQHGNDSFETMNPSMVSQSHNLGEPEYILLRQKRVEEIKSRLNSWRQTFLILVEILLWEKVWYPAAVLGFTTTLFGVIWWLDLSVLSMLAIGGIIVTGADLALPVFLSFFSCCADSWIAQDDDRFQEICEMMLDLKDALRKLAWKITNFRKNMPRVFSMFLAFSFLFGAWLFAKFNNLLVVYLVATGTLLAPGALKAGIHLALGQFCQDKYADLISRWNERRQSNVNLKV